MKLYFNFWPDPSLFILKIFFNFVLILVFLIILTALITLLISEFKKIYIQKKSINLLNEKIFKLKNKLQNEIINSQNDDLVIKNFLEYIQLFMIKNNISNLQDLFNKLDMPLDIQIQLIDYITKNKSISDKVIFYIKNFFKNANHMK